MKKRKLNEKNLSFLISKCKKNQFEYKKNDNGIGIGNGNGYEAKKRKKNSHTTPHHMNNKQLNKCCQTEPEYFFLHRKSI